MKQGNLIEQLKSLPRAKLARLQKETAAHFVSGHALVAAALQRCGITRVYGVSGTPIDQIFAECAARGIRPLATFTQDAAVHMAAAGNYVAGRLEAAVVVSSGPAVTNTVTGLLVASENGWPVVVLGGRKALHDEGIGYFQELDAVPIVSPVTKMAATIRKTGDIMETICHACSVAQTARRGPVYLDLPEDVLEARAGENEVSITQPVSAEEIDQEAVNEAAQLLAQAQRPLLILGEDLRWSFHADSLGRLVEDCGIPFITSPMGRGCLPDDHELCANEMRRALQRQADVIVMAGAWFDWRFRFGTELAPDAQIIHADANRLTLGKNINASVTLLGEPGEFLARLVDSLGTMKKANGQMRYSAWHDSLAQARLEMRKTREPWLTERSVPMLPQQLYLTLRDLLPANAIVTVEGNVCLAAAQKTLQARRPFSWLDPGRNGIIGACIPFAMGAKLACPERPVIALCSDAGFGMSAMNLEAAVRHRIPIVVIIANNDGNSGSVRQKHFFPENYPERFTMFLPELRYERIMEIFGGHAEYVKEVAGIQPAFERALEANIPACINVRLNPDTPHSGFW